MVPQPNSSGLADMQIVIRYQYPAHSGSPSAHPRASRPCHWLRWHFQTRISAGILFRPQTWRAVCPPRCI